MTELAILVALVLLNGLLAGSELAVVSARKERLQRLADAGSRAAKATLLLRRDPERFLATVQVGITLVGAFAAAYSGTALAKRLEPWLVEYMSPEAAEDVAFAAVVVFVTWLTVVFGELVPKSLALRVAERFAMAAARPLQVIEWVARPVVWLFAKSSNLVLKAFRDQTTFIEGRITREDLQHMVEEATSGGSLDPATSRLMERALEFTQLRVDDVMVHRRAVKALPVDATKEQARAVFLEHGHRRVPVYEGTIDRVLGYVLLDDVVALVWDGKPFALADLVRPPVFVPEVAPAAKVLRDLQQRRVSLAIVVEEHGGVSGIVTVGDLVEELVGEIFDERDAGTASQVRREGDGVWLVQGTADTRHVERRLGIELPETAQSRTIGGLLVELAGGQLPKPGETFPHGRVTLEAVDVSARRVRSVRVRKRPPGKRDAAAASERRSES